MHVLKAFTLVATLVSGAAHAQPSPMPRMVMPDVVGEVTDGVALRGKEGSYRLDISKTIFLRDGTEYEYDNGNMKKITSYDKNAPYSVVPRLFLALRSSLFDGQSIMVPALSFVGATLDRAIAPLDVGYVEIDLAGVPPKDLVDIVARCASLVPATFDCAFDVSGRVIARDGHVRLTGVTLRHAK